MGSIMRSAVNHSSISRDRLSLPETIYWIPRSKWAFFLFSPVFRELFRGSVCPFSSCWAALSPPFTHEDSFLNFPTSSVPAFPPPHPPPPVFAKTFLPPLAQWLHNTHQLFPATEPGREPRLLLADFWRGGRAGCGGGDRGGTHLKKLKLSPRNKGARLENVMGLSWNGGVLGFPPPLFLTKNSIKHRIL